MCTLSSILGFVFSSSLMEQFETLVTEGECLGFALIRGIDVKNQELHLLTPVDVNEEVVGGRDRFTSP